MTSSTRSLRSRARVTGEPRLGGVTQRPLGGQLGMQDALLRDTSPASIFARLIAGEPECGMAYTNDIPLGERG
jgi:hypothetical protein